MDLSLSLDAVKSLSSAAVLHGLANSEAKSLEVVEAAGSMVNEVEDPAAFQAAMEPPCFENATLGVGHAAPPTIFLM